ncbi:hypothetical protein POPTR_009G102850v4 [Populus trichocarpa]|uniref:Uncharacterized protein n=1 Tax=Populus trichocarpa TaxID=3694 RepID=A0ACC0SHG7_POPTR|nr:hypothetical protein POPTR_009G102850v4 [Populus trichocarpa]
MASSYGNFIFFSQKSCISCQDAWTLPLLPLRL